MADVEGPRLRVYIWRFTGLDNIGHASMTLTDKTHISWWPWHADDSDSKKRYKRFVTGLRSVPPVDDQTYEADVGDEGREADTTIEFLPGDLDEVAIKKWWIEFKKSKKYNLLYNNCSTVVYKALSAGGAAKYARVRVQPAVWEPNGIRRYAERLSKAIRKKAKEEQVDIEVDEEFVKVAKEVESK